MLNELSSAVIGWSKENCVKALRHIELNINIRAHSFSFSGKIKRVIEIIGWIRLSDHHTRHISLEQSVYAFFIIMVFFISSWIILAFSEKSSWNFQVVSQKYNSKEDLLQIHKVIQFRCRKKSWKYRSFFSVN